MDPLALVSALVALTALGIAARAYVLWAQTQVKPTSETPPEDHKTAYLEVLAAKVAGLETKVADLPSLFENEVKRVTSQANRAAQAVTDLDRRLAPSGEGDQDGDDEFVEGEGVFPIDGALGEAGGVPAVPARLGGIATEEMRARYRAALAAKR